jgi:hypothetical protein
MIKNELKHRTIYMLGAISVIMLFLAYQVETPFELDLGERGDEAYLHNFYATETTHDLSYRWSSDRSSIFLPGIGGYAPALLRLRLNGSRPDGLPPPVVSLRANGRELTSFTATDQFETYEFVVDRETMGISGDLEIQLDSQFFVPAEVMGGDDLRRLGVLVDFASVEFERTLTSIVIPPPRQMIYVVFAVMTSLLLVRQLGLSRATSLVIGGLVLLALLLLAVQYRLVLGRYSSWLFLLLAFANIAMVLGRLVRGSITREGKLLDADITDFQFILAVMVILALGQYTNLAFLRQMRQDRATDFFINFAATTVLAQGGNIYDIASLREASQLAEPPLTSFDFGSLFVTYITPPFHVILLLPFAPLGYEKARITFLLLNNLLLFSSLAIILKAGRAKWPTLPQFLLALLLVFTLEPIHVSLQLGQVDFVILFLIAVTFWAYKGGRNIMVGVCLALAAMIKLSPAVLIIYFLWKREFSIFVSAVITALMVGILSWLMVGSEAIMFFSTSILPALLKGSAFFQNQSLNGFFSRLFADPGLYYSLQEFPSIPQVRTLSTLASLALVAMGAFVTRKRISRNSLRFDLEFSLVIVTMLLGSTISWEHYFTWLLLPFLVLLNPRLQTCLTPRRYLTVIAGAFAAYLTVTIPSSFYAMTLHASNVGLLTEMALTLLLSLRVYGALLLYSIFVYLIPRFPSRESREASRWTHNEIEEVSL